ncbi:cation diffusion facilitator family transporter [Proteiniphilum saccharofermentans]|jgi:cation diffusion facilitator family transporter|uniref:cation diffusion facilitator family transporter n=1 Tax=Proteiniphilum saccharofermentans TaxID=1642647 RepID=UPI0028A5B9C4|nr:cation diffusion facilitator family transporter [Proteiniphilum saccharofermentans]MCK9438091.1 cation diffusion facilitator family transporter [Synergistaceae bacterium]
MDKTRAGYLEGIISVIVNSILFILKFWAGVITGSIALTADAWHTLSDSLSSIIVIVAVKLSSKKPDTEHPFGHGRWEQIAALFIAFLLGIIAFDFFKDSFTQFKNQKSTEFGTIAIVVTIISIIVKEALAQYAFYIGRKTENVSIKADGWHHRTDALSSVVVLVGILFAKQFWWVDSVLGAIISIMLFYATYQIAKEAINKLLGEKPSSELIEKIKNSIKQYDLENIQLHHFHIHNYVGHQELTFHIKLRNDLSIEEGHRIATEIENTIEEKFGIVSTIHVEPMTFNHNSD